MVSIASQTYFPPSDAENGLAEVVRFLDEQRDQVGSDSEPHYFLSGSELKDQVELPREIYDVLVAIVNAMKNDLAVTIRPNAERVTTQQAAEILGVSRPTVVRLVDSGALPAEKVGRHRRIRLSDVLVYQEVQSSAHRDALVATTDLVTELPSSEYFKSIRKRVAAQRKTAQSEMVSLCDGE